MDDWGNARLLPSLIALMIERILLVERTVVADAAAAADAGRIEIIPKYSERWFVRR